MPPVEEPPSVDTRISPVKNVDSKVKVHYKNMQLANKRVREMMMGQSSSRPDAKVRLETPVAKRLDPMVIIRILT
jgi:hypothetical protein